MTLRQNLIQFTAATNRVMAERVAKMNEEYREGKRLFGASHRDLPQDFMRVYHDQGLTPEQAADRIMAGE